MNKLSNLIKAQKDPLPASCKKNVVFKISCKDCDATYVGQIMSDREAIENENL